MLVLLSGVKTLFCLNSGNTYSVHKDNKQKADDQAIHIDQITTPEWWASLNEHDANLLHYYYLTIKYQPHD